MVEHINKFISKYEMCKSIRGEYSIGDRIRIANNLQLGDENVRIKLVHILKRNKEIYTHNKQEVEVDFKYLSDKSIREIDKITGKQFK